jgi:hypothetical protein
MKYITTELEQNLASINKRLFTNLDWEKIIENEDSFVRFIWLVQSWYRSKLALWQAKWNEWMIYNYVECLEDLKKQIKNIWQSMNNYNLKKDD